ncbi:MAG: methyltransferase domain-containing protein [Actinomycetota bacterium]|nr:methyltransferase domain-containing protein [Actinomycetota bacterium]
MREEIASFALARGDERVLELDPAEDPTALPHDRAAFDLTVAERVLARCRRPELAVAELSRVTSPGGSLVVIERLGAVDPLVSLERDRYERQREPSHVRFLPDGDLRAMFEMNGLVLVRERRDGDDGWYLLRR